jgi:fructokinase
VNLRQHYYSRTLIEESLALVNVLKVNDAELPILAEMFAISGNERTGHSTCRTFRVAHGRPHSRPAWSLLLRDGGWSEHPAHATGVVDTVGAGDAFTAAMTLGLLAGWDLSAINQHANEVAGFVCSRAGATPRLPSRCASRSKPFRRVERDASAPEVRTKRIIEAETIRFCMIVSLALLAAVAHRASRCD